MDGDAPLSPGNPHLLAAVRTFEIAMVPILHSIAPGDPKIPNRGNRLKKFSVFGSASGQIPGQHREENQNKEQVFQKDKEKPVADQLNNPGDEVQYEHKCPQLIDAIAAIHKSHQSLSNHGGCTSLRICCLTVYPI